ncbi:MAG: anion permease, partial [Eggerthellaceae bacterium]|nr:anion permease [Eggerthellaceae bacterium]
LILAYTADMGINPVIVTMLVFTSVSMHFLLPFHALPVTVGMDPGGFSNKETLRLGIHMTIAIFVLGILVFIPWWQLLGYV